MELRRTFGLPLFTILIVILVVTTIYIGLSWQHVKWITNPVCNDPVPLEDTQAPIEYWLPTEDGISFRVWYYPSQNGAVILAFGDEYGALGDRLPIIETLLRYGYGIVQVDSRTCAQPSAPVTFGGNEIYDAEAALRFAKSRTEIDQNRIGTFGFDMGCITAFRITANYPEIKGVVCDGGSLNLNAILSPLKKIIFQIQTNTNSQKINPLSDLPAIKPRPIYLIYGEFEANSGIEQFEAAYEPKELWLVPLGSHGRNHIVNPGIYAAYLSGFFEIALLK